MDGTLQAKIPHRRPMEISSELFSSLLKYYPLRQIRYITSPQTWWLRATSFCFFPLILQTVFGASFIHRCLHPPWRSGWTGLFFSWRFTEAQESETLAREHLEPSIALPLPSPCTGHRKAHSQSQGGAGNYTPPQGDREGNDHLLEDILSGRNEKEPLRRQIRFWVWGTPSAKWCEWFWKLHGIAEAFGGKLDSHSFCLVSLELLCSPVHSGVLVSGLCEQRLPPGQGTLQPAASLQEIFSCSGEVKHYSKFLESK